VSAPELTGVLETVLYYTDEEETFRFYTEVLGMRSVGRTPGRQIFLRAGSSMFLLFDAEATRRPGSLPPHGATGPGHVCFLVALTAYDQ
jgi:catechol 2,3-dioxygenase-like lactoylglutathione lyase family enzyme